MDLIEVTCAVLAGGHSRRFERDKGLIKLRNKPLVTHVIERCGNISNDLVVVVHDSKQLAGYQQSLPDTVTIVQDQEGLARSPVVGIASALEHANYPYTLILPCDSPLVSVDVLRNLIQKAAGFDAAIPKWQKGWIEPLHAVYKTGISKDTIKPFLKLPRSRIKEFIDKLPQVNYVPIEDFKRWDPKLLTFSNINTVEDLTLLSNNLKASKG